MSAMSGSIWQSALPLKMTGCFTQGEFARIFRNLVFLLDSQGHTFLPTTRIVLASNTSKGINGLATLKSAIKQTLPLLEQARSGQVTAPIAV
jgi:hypothetical protein